MGALLTTASECVAVEYPSDPDAPFVAISAPGVVGSCDDVVLEGLTSYTSLGACMIDERVHGRGIYRHGQRLIFDGSLHHASSI